MADFKIRFNTEHKSSELKWRVLIDEEEYLAKQINVNCPCKTSEDWILINDFPALKYHISCESEKWDWSEDKILIIS